MILLGSIVDEIQCVKICVMSSMMRLYQLHEHFLILVFNSVITTCARGKRHRRVSTTMNMRHVQYTLGVEIFAMNEFMLMKVFMIL